MFHNIKIFFTLAAINLKVTLAYRASLLFSLILNIFWAASFIVFIEVIFRNVTTLGGVTRGEALLIMAFYYFFTNISDIVYRDNFEQFGQKMRTGQIDMWLTKPAWTRMLMFMVSMRFDYIAALSVTIALFIYAFRALGYIPDIRLLLSGFLLSLIGHIIFFSVLSILATFNFWLEKTDTLNMIGWQISQVGRYPRKIFTSAARVVLTYIIPLALLANMPAEVALHVATPQMLVTFILIATILYVISFLFWKKGLTRYSSAG